MKFNGRATDALLERPTCDVCGLVPAIADCATLNGSGMIHHHISGHTAGHYVLWIAIAIVAGLIYLCMIRLAEKIR